MKRMLLMLTAVALALLLAGPASQSFAAQTTLDFTSLFGGATAGDQGTTLTFDGLTISAKVGVGTNVNPWSPPTVNNPATNNNSGGVAGDVYWGNLGPLGTTSTTTPPVPAAGSYFGLGVGTDNTTGPITFKDALVFDFDQPQDPKNALFFGSIQSSTDLAFKLLGTNALASGGSAAPADNVRMFIKVASGEIVQLDINAGALSPNPLGNPSPDALDWNYWIRGGLNGVNYADEHILGLAVEQIYGSAATPNRQFGFGSITYYAPDPVPEPLTLLLFGVGLVGLVGVRRLTK